MAQTMKAFVVNTYGPNGGIYTDAIKPTPSPGQILVKICAASINPLDKMVQGGEFKLLLPYKRPFILGHDLAGVVVGVGPGVEQFKVDDEVYARPRDMHIGTFAEYIAIEAEDAALKPRNLSMAEAASVPLVALAAWQLLKEQAQIKPGQSILVHAGAGGLGSTVVQLAHELGAVVTTTVGTRDVAKVCALGATTAIDYTKEKFETQQARYDVVIDSVGGENLKKSLQVVKRGGLVSSVVGPPDAAFAQQLGKTYLKPLMYLLSSKMKRVAKKAGAKYAFFFMRASGAQLKSLASLYENGRLRPVVDKTFPFDQISEALEYARSGKARGKVVMMMGG